MFTEQQLVSFGNFLLKTYGVQVHSTDGKNLPVYQRQVTDADFCNWKNEEKPNELPLPSLHQIKEDGNYIPVGTKVEIKKPAVLGYGRKDNNSVG